jgi:hypothetical protein
MAPEALYGELAVDLGDHDVTDSGVITAMGDQDVTVVDPIADHRVTTDPDIYHRVRSTA